ncbi:protein kintoun [Cylas formicarius]|uniref:protein kintoun n=1 Tax=Cylas formicarius TaxID=197179 RepID=UPI0029584FDA|nr:protein kintoun [Cylas formicarius]
MESSFEKLKELNLSRDEVDRLGKALKNDEFRKLLTDYVDELQDPKNRQIYEKEVKQLEKERGQDVTFLHPSPGYVIKTSVDGTQKGFINISSNQNIGQPTSNPCIKEGVKGLQWSLPHSLSPPREDTDNKGVRCQVYDVLFHPDTIHLASKNLAFRSLVNNVALDAVETNFHVKLDKKNLKFPKMSYKGFPQASIVRKPSETKPLAINSEDKEFYDRLYSHIDGQRNSQAVKSSPQRNKTRKNNIEDDSAYTVPKYVIKHRTNVDIQEFTESKEAKLNTTIPKELIVEVNLPLLKSSNDISLDVTEKTVQLISENPVKYKLNLTLPYEVTESNGTAKFDKDLKKLSVTLPVKSKHRNIYIKYDSGVESDIASPAGLDLEDNLHKKLVSEIGSVSSLETQQQLRTKIDECDSFLDINKLYNLPEFTCNVFDNIVAFTFHVKNVDDRTVVKQCDKDKSLVKVKFTSISSSFFSSHYSFFVKFESHNIQTEDITIEVWDNNVILQIPLIPCDMELSSYFCGASEDDLKEKIVEEPFVINKHFEKAMQENQIQVLEKSTHDCFNGNIEKQVEIDVPKLSSKAIDIPFSSYESSGDELSYNSFSPRKSKGILKRISCTRSSFVRSVSESSLDDYVVCSSIENGSSSFEFVIPEDVELSTSLKKTVRFNDVVSRQLFRSNSSILGQKKKNQRKARNKKRAHDRRHSESETSDNESKREVDTNTEESKLNNGIESGGKKDESDIFHLEINY